MARGLARLSGFTVYIYRTLVSGLQGGEELASQSYNVEIPSPIYLYQEIIYCDGMYYGSWELQSI